MREIKYEEKRKVWFRWSNCNQGFDDDLEKMEDEISWAYSPTSYENRMDAIKKSRIREKHENRLDKIVVCDVEDIGSTLTGVWKGNYETKKC